MNFDENNLFIDIPDYVKNPLGIDGTDKFDVPYPNIVVDFIQKNGDLGVGVSNYLASVIKAEKISIDEICSLISNNKIDITKYPIPSKNEVDKLLKPYIDLSLSKIKENKR